MKEFKHEVDNEDIKLATDSLHRTGTDPEERRKIETEQDAWRTINAMFEDKEKELLKKLAEKDKALDEMAKELEELKRKLGEK